MNAKEWVRSAGAVLVPIGLGCFPLGFGVSPKRDTSIFNNLADLGAFVKCGLVLLAMGVAVVLVSFMMPGDKGK
jgi:hypothetical protein